MKSVLISIQPRWCELIATGEKTLEVRKTRPKLETPFKVYIYCTAGTGKNTFNMPISAEQIARHYAETGSMERLNCPIGNQKVIGEFICDTFVIDKTFGHDASFNAAACMTEIECAAYSTCSPIYGWHISDLKIYDKPKNIADFNFPPETYCEKGLCGGCPYDCVTGESGDVMFDCEWKRPLKRAPQSWCYVEELPCP